MPIVKGIDLPDFLFCKNKSLENVESPFDVFDCESALRGKPWQVTTSPLKEVTKKTLIFNKSSFYELALWQVIPFITKLRGLGFEIMLCCENGGEADLIKLENHRELPDLLPKLANVKEADIHKLAAKKSLPKDNSVLINYQKREIIHDIFNHQCVGTVELGFLANHLLADIRDPNKANTKKGFNLALALSYCRSKADVRSLVGKMKGNNNTPSIDELGNCIATFPDLWKELMAFYPSLSADRENIFNHLFVLDRLFGRKIPEEILLEILADSPTAKCLADCASLLPNRAHELVARYHEVIKSSADAAYVLDAVPSCADEIMSRVSLERDDYKTLNKIGLKYGKTHQIFCIKYLREARVRALAATTPNKKDLTDCLALASNFMKEVIVNADAAHLIKYSDEIDAIAQDIITKLQDLIVDGEELADILEINQVFAAHLIQSCGSAIQDGNQLVRCVGSAPQCAAKLLRMHKSYALDPAQLRSCLSHLKKSDFATSFVKRHRSEIVNRDILLLCIKVAPSLAAELLQDFSMHIVKLRDVLECIKYAPQLAGSLIDRYGKYITDGVVDSSFAAENFINSLKRLSLSAADVAPTLIARYAITIKTGKDLLLLFEERISERFVQQVIESRKGELVIDVDSFVRCVGYAPDCAADLLELCEQNILTGDDLSRCIIAAPQLAARLINKHQDKLAGLTNLATCLKVAPECSEELIAANSAPQKASELLLRFRDLFAQDLSIACSDDHALFVAKLHSESERVGVKYAGNKPHLISCSGLDDLKFVLSRKQVVEEASVILIRDIKLKEVPTLLSWLKADLPNVCHVVLPNSVLMQLASSRPSVWDDRYSLEAFDPIGFSRPMTDADFGAGPATQAIVARRVDNPAVEVVDAPRGILIAQNGLTDSYFYKDGSVDGYTMQLAGEVLNGSSNNLRVRTGIIRDNDITKNLNCQILVPTVIKPLEIRVLDDRGIAALKSKVASQEGIYYSFNIALKAGQLHRLPSASAIENFVGIKSDDPKAKIALYYSEEDNFFYAKADRSCSISHVTQVKRVNNWLTIPDSDPIKQIITEYFTKKSTDDKLPQYQAENHAAFLKYIYEKRIGSCAHRVAAFKYRIATAEGIDQNRIRSVDIDNNHVIIEVEYNGEWYPVNLGGVNTVNRFSSEKYTPEAVPSDIAIAKDNPAASKAEVLPARKPTSTVVVAAAHDVSVVERFMRHKIEPSKIIRTADGLRELIASDSRRAILIQSASVEIAANSILAMARREGRQIFYIDSPEKLGLQDRHILISPDGSVSIDPSSELVRFLQTVKAITDPMPILMIDWSLFTEAQILAMNSLLDSKKSILGNAVPDHLQVFSLCHKSPKDISFLSRHGHFVRYSNRGYDGQKTKVVAEQLIIDFKGYPDWRRQLFGAVVLDGKKMRWRRSDFAEVFASGEKVVRFCNIDPKEAKELAYELNQAKALGYITYYGHRIAVDPDLQFAFEDKAFDFRRFKEFESSVALTRDETCNNISCQAVVINSCIFDRLLVGKKIEGGSYFSLPGLIEQHSGKELEIFVTANLSEAQWYSLFEEAAQKKVRLRISLAKGVGFPDEVKATILRKEELGFGDDGELAQVYITNNVDQVARELLTKNRGATIVAVEDYSYSTLVSKTEFITTETGFENFIEIKSDIIARLKAGQKVILKGEFSEGLLQVLHPIISGEGEFAEFKQNLMLIVENDVIASTAISHPAFSFLPESQVVTAYREVRKSAPQIHKENTKPFEGFDNGAAKSRAFVRSRKDMLRGLLADNSILALTGHSGVGKSGLIAMLERDDQDEFKIYHEINSIEAWLADDSRLPAILFLDDVTFDHSHLTRFSELKRDGTREFLYRGKIYNLSSRHKVIFASANSPYQAGEIGHKLFKDGSIPELCLDNLPSSYVYKAALEPIYGGLSSGMKKIIAEDGFRRMCWAVQSDPAQHFTVLELQEKALSYIADQMQERGVMSELRTADYITTDATREVEHNLRRFLAIREWQKEGMLPRGSIGTNGIFLEGDSGIGKSAMVRAMFARQGYCEAQGDDLTHFSDRKLFYRLDASMKLEEKIRLLSKARKEGNGVWVDEINSCLVDGFKEILKSTLTGMNLQSDDVEKSGFFLVATGNQISNEGREDMGSLMSCLLHQKLKPLVEYGEDDVRKIIKHIAPNGDQDKLVTFFNCMIEEYPEWSNLRVFADFVRGMDRGMLDDKAGTTPAAGFDLVEATRFASATTAVADATLQ